MKKECDMKGGEMMKGGKHMMPNGMPMPGKSHPKGMPMKEMPKAPVKKK